MLPTTAQESELDVERRTALFAHWKTNYERTCGCAFVGIDTESRYVIRMGKLLTLAGSVPRAKKAIEAMFELDWLDSFSLEFLLSPSNFSRFIAPKIRRKKRKGRIDYEGERSDTFSADIRLGSTV